MMDVIYLNLTQEQLDEAIAQWRERRAGVDVATVGKWIEPNEFFDPNVYRKCSLCGTHFDIYPPYKTFDGRVCYPAARVCNYCPNCGAKMEPPK